MAPAVGSAAPPPTWPPALDPSQFWAAAAAFATAQGAARMHAPQHTVGAWGSRGAFPGQNTQMAAWQAQQATWHQQQMSGYGSDGHNMQQWPPEALGSTLAGGPPGLAGGLSGEVTAQQQWSQRAPSTQSQWSSWIGRSTTAQGDDSEVDKQILGLLRQMKDGNNSSVE